MRKRFSENKKQQMMVVKKIFEEGFEAAKPLAEKNDHPVFPDYFKR